MASIFPVAVSMPLAAAHALELQSKMRLDKQAYLAVQTIYYSGSTHGGATEGLGILAVLGLLVMTRTDQHAFWWLVAALAALVALHAAYWAITRTQ